MEVRTHLHQTGGIQVQRASSGAQERMGVIYYIGRTDTAEDIEEEQYTSPDDRKRKR